MLTYRGDKFVKGKKFKINEQFYRFSKYDNEGMLIFEAEDKKSLRISKEEYDEMSRYDLVQADEAKLDEFYNDSALTFEGCTTDKDNIDYLYNWLKELGCIKEGNGPLAIYTYKGSLMNDKYQLTGSNRYPADLNIITVMLKDIEFNGKLPLARMELGGRWFDDIVDNNNRREGREDMIESAIIPCSETLLEKINQENKEKNELIGKILRSKSLARKHEKDLNDLGIKVDYDKGQGVTLVGPNGKELSSSTKEVYGPARPGHGRTHEKEDKYYSGRVRDYEKRHAEYKEKLAGLQSLERDDIIRKYNDKSTADALKAHEEEIARHQKYVDDYAKDVEEYKQRAKSNLEFTKRYRRAGHKGYVGYYDDSVMAKDTSNDKVDYLNYLTKKDYGKPTGNRPAHNYVGDSKQSSGDDRYYGSHYYGRNGNPSFPSEKRQKYTDLKKRVDWAKDEVAKSSENSGSWSQYKSDDVLEKEIQAMRDDLEKRIERLRAENDSHKAGNQKNIENLKAKEKELDDYLKSLGIRESVIESVKKEVLRENVSSFKEIYGEDTDYTELRKIVDALHEICDQAKRDGFNFVDEFETAIIKLSSVVYDIEEFYEHQ